MEAGILSVSVSRKVDLPLLLVGRTRPAVSAANKEEMVVEGDSDGPLARAIDTEAIALANVFFCNFSVF